MATVEPQRRVGDHEAEQDCEACGAEPTPRNPVYHAGLVDDDGAEFDRLCRSCLDALTSHVGQ